MIAGPSRAGPAAAPDPITERLRTATWPLHRQAEGSALMRRLLAGRFDRSLYAALLSSLHAIYAALEAALDGGARHTRLSGVVERALYRRDALADDLRALCGGRAPPPAAVAQRYAERLTALAADAPVRLLGHAYVRYLGDLNGGRVLARAVARALGDEAPLAFYDFGSAARPAAQAAALRGALDAVALTSDEREALVDEAVWAFNAHLALFAELAAGDPAAPRPPG